MNSSNWSDQTLDFAYPQCAFNEPYTEGRFALVISATSLAILGVFFNGALLVFFIGANRQSSIYLALLAFLDCCLCINYILLFGVDAVAIYYRLPEIFLLWNNYLIVVYGLSRIVQLSIPYIVLAATFERWLILVGNFSVCPWVHSLVTHWGRRCAALIILSGVIILKAPVFWDLRLHHYTNCTDYFGSMEIIPTELALRVEYHIYDFYFMTVIQVFLPFFSLIFLNLLIIRRLSKVRTSKQSMIAHGLRVSLGKSGSIITASTGDDNTGKLLLRGRRDREKKVRIRSATLTMVVLVFSHLICNSLHVFISSMERLNVWGLLKRDDDTSTEFYTASADVISFLFMFSSFLRLPIYLVCNPHLRQDFMALMCKRLKAPELL